MICTPCGEVVPEGRQAIYGIEREGRLHFGWTCCHAPVADASVIIASETCLEKWLKAHPDYVEEVYAVVVEHQHNPGRHHD